MVKNKIQTKIKKENVAPKEKTVINIMLEKLKSRGGFEKKTKKPVIIGMIGLTGSGKSFVANDLAGRIGASVISADEIRVELRKQKIDYEKSRRIVEELAKEIIMAGGNVILDSDFIDSEKRNNLKQAGKKLKIEAIFIRIFCEKDVMIGRILNGDYSADEFFKCASSVWQDEKTKSAVIKMREMWRRTPHHYKWINQEGGKWELKKFTFPIFAEIDTTDDKKYSIALEKTAKRILKM